MGKKENYVIGIINGGKNVNTINYVTDVDMISKIAKWEAGKEAKIFESKSYAEDIAFGLCANGYAAVVMIKPNYLKFKNPVDCIRKNTNETLISGIVHTHKNGNLEYWDGFNLTKEEENELWKILEKHDTEGCSICGSKEDIAKEFLR